MRFLLVPSLALFTATALAKAPQRHEAPAYLEEGSHGTWTRCAAGIAGAKVDFCGTRENITTCLHTTSRMTATQWIAEYATLYRMEEHGNPVKYGGIHELSLVSANIFVGNRAYRCELEMTEDKRLVVSWARLVDNDGERVE